MTILDALSFAAVPVYSCWITRLIRFLALHKWRYTSRPSCPAVLITRIFEWPHFLTRCQPHCWLFYFAYTAHSVRLISVCPSALFPIKAPEERLELQTSVVLTLDHNLSLFVYTVPSEIKIHVISKLACPYWHIIGESSTPT